MSICPFAVLESRWWSEGNHSVKVLFEAVASIHYDNPSAFYYDMFANKSSLKTVLDVRAQDARTEVIYLATHGDESTIGPNALNSISRTELRNAIVNANSDGQVKGLFLGTCMTGNAKMAKYLLSSGSKLKWVAGYSKSVDWLDGSAIDMIFFSKLAELYVLNKSKKKGKLSAQQMSHKAASELIKLVQGAHTTYGFNIFFQENTGLTSMFN